MSFEVPLADNGGVGSSKPMSACLLIDLSRSMGWNTILGKSKISTTQSVLDSLRAMVMRDERLRTTADFAFLGFPGTGDAMVELLSDYAPMDAHPPITLEVTKGNGGTPIAAALDYGWDLSEQRQQHYRDQFLVPYRPQTFVITDGGATDKADELQRVGDRFKNANGRLGDLYILYIEDAKQEEQNVALNQLQHYFGVQPKVLNADEFVGLFKWITATLTMAMAGKRPDGGLHD